MLYVVARSQTCAVGRGGECRVACVRYACVRFGLRASRLYGGVFGCGLGVECGWSVVRVVAHEFI